MAIKTVSIGPFLGINNKLPSDKLQVPRTPSSAGGTFVRDAVNVDLTAAGTFQRRPGAALALAGSRCRSLWGNGATGYFADGNRLMSFNGASSAQVALLSGADVPVSYAKTPRGVVWSDGSKLELIESGVSRPLAVPAPNPEPVATAGAGGSLAAGSYLIAFAHINAQGERSVLTFFTVLELADGGAIDIAFSAGRAMDTAVFVSACSGSQLFQEAVQPASLVATSLRLGIITSQGQPVGDEFEAAMPAGTIVRAYRGRLLTVFGNTVYYSLPYDYGATRPASHFVMLDAAITLCEPDENGVYLATASGTWFARGGDFAAAALDPIAPYGAIPNTAVAAPNSLDLWWSSARGAVKASNGQVELPQDARIAFAPASNGAALFREENGLVQLVSVLSGAVPTGAASASSYMDAESVN